MLHITNHGVAVSHKYVIELNNDKYIIVLWTNTYGLHPEVLDFDSLDSDSGLPIKLKFLYFYNSSTTYKYFRCNILRIANNLLFNK
jgi:hypothetical protein